MSDIYFFTASEVMATGYSEWSKCLSDYSNLSDVPSLIEASYGGWYGNWTDSTEAATQTSENLARRLQWQAWLRQKAIYWDAYITRQEALTGKTSAVSHLIETPETETDYIGDTHITNVSRSESMSDNVTGLDRLKPVKDALVEAFRKAWLTPPESI